MGKNQVEMLKSQLESAQVLEVLKSQGLKSQVEQQPPAPREDSVEGELFRVVFKGKMVVRQTPSVTAGIIDKLKPGEEVMLLEADETGKWRKLIRPDLHPDIDQCAGWVLTHSDQLGTLLEKVLDVEGEDD